MQLANGFNSANQNIGAFALDELKSFRNGFDILVTCTSSPEAIVTGSVYDALLAGDKNKKILIDLALPADIHHEVISGFEVQYIGLNELKKEAEQNLREREAEVQEASRIIEEGIEEFRSQFRTRKVELKMREVPEKIREIKTRAMTDVFATEINSLDDRSKEVLQNVMDYMEKKCISVPMIMAKEIILSSR